MRVLVACEYSGKVRDAFTRHGHDAMSCDLLPTDSPGPHYQGDVRDLLQCGFWDLMIAHPPCTYLCGSGLHWNKRRPGRADETAKALAFVGELFAAPIDLIALENPKGAISGAYRPADQIIQPWQYGHDASKQTCLWLKGLPLLRPTCLVTPRMVCGCGHVFDSSDVFGCPNCCGDYKARPRWGNQTDSGQNKLSPSADRWKIRSETYAGIAEAFADQWGGAGPRAGECLAGGVARGAPGRPDQSELFNV